MTARCLALPPDEIKSEAVALRGSTVIVLLDELLSDEEMRTLAERLLAIERGFIAVFGERAKRFHDIVDDVAIRDREFGPITIWDDESTLSEFLWNVFFPYSGFDSRAEEEGVGILNVCSSGGRCENVASILSEWNVRCEAA
jgi:hypothetical protein